MLALFKSTINDPRKLSQDTAEYVFQVFSVNIESLQNDSNSVCETVTSVSSERLFLKPDAVVSDRQSNLKPRRVPNVCTKLA